MPNVSQYSLENATNANEPLALRAQPGGVLLVFFGFTYCPDICPTTMAEVRLVRQDIGELGNRAVPAMVSIDPARDTSEVLTTYVRRFSDDGIALRSDDQMHLKEVTRAFGASYEVSQTPGQDPEVGHSAHLYAVDDQGRIRVQWPFGTARQDIEHDLKLLFKQIDDEKKATS